MTLDLADAADRAAARAILRSILRNKQKGAYDRDRRWAFRAKRHNARALQAERNLGLAQGSLGRVSAAELRELVAEHDSLCAHCKCKLDFDRPMKNGDPKAATFDHIMELARGGLGTKENLAPSCLKCNNGRDHLRLKRARLAPER